MGLLLGSVSCLLTGGLAAQSALSISRAVYIENRAESSAAGTVRAIEPASTLQKGDRVVLLVEWNAASPGLQQTARGYLVSSEVPRHLAFQQSSHDTLEISADGGRSWGRLGTLRIASRLASPEDATHLRWSVAPSRLAKGRGRIAYSALVR
ncbi:MAG: hypothetical protein ABJM58_05350 [Alteripontixanthobacter sp.]